jgi:hypothetical protein
VGARRIGVAAGRGDAVQALPGADGDLRQAIVARRLCKTLCVCVRACVCVCVCARARVRTRKLVCRPCGKSEQLAKTYGMEDIITEVNTILYHEQYSAAAAGLMCVAPSLGRGAERARAGRPLTLGSDLRKF